MDGDLVGSLVHPVQLVDEVHVPGRAPELTVGGGLKADVFLHAHDVTDRAVLDRSQLVGRDVPSGERSTRRQQLGWPKQAADMVSAEGRVAGDRHQFVLLSK